MFKSSALLINLALITTIYSYQIKTSEGNLISLKDFQGKKILFVNTSSTSKYVDQYAKLEMLQTLYKDSLVIIAIPSDSFGNEPLSNSSIKRFVEENYKIHYILSEKMQVKGKEKASIYKWLTEKSENGVLSNEVGGDFFKFLVNESGSLIGVFASSVDPLSEELRSVITTNP